MTKLEDYFERKRVIDLALPKLYIVKSTRDGVEQPVEKQVIEIKKSGIRLSPTKKQIYKYIVEGSPYEVNIVDGETSNMIEGYGTGFGDLWEWSYYSSFSKEDADAYYLEESERVKEKYKN